MINISEIKAHGAAFMDDAITLIRKEGELVKAELGEKVADVQKGVVASICAALIGFAGIIFLGHAVSAWLAVTLGFPVAYAIVGTFLVLIAAVAAFTARSNMSAENLKPEKTLETAQQAAARVKGEMK